MGGVGALLLWNGLVAFYHCYCDRNKAPEKYNAIPLQPLLVATHWGSAGMFTQEELWWNWQNWQYRMDKIHNHVKIINQGIKWWEYLYVFKYFSCILLQFQAWCQRIEYNKVTAECFDAFKFAVKLVFESLLQKVKHAKNGEIWRLNVDFDPKGHIQWSQCG